VKPCVIISLARAMQDYVRPSYTWSVLTQGMEFMN
jgi:hypothetical protein